MLGTNRGEAGLILLAAGLAYEDNKTKPAQIRPATKSFLQEVPSSTASIIPSLDAYSRRTGSLQSASFLLFVVQRPESHSRLNLPDQLRECHFRHLSGEIISRLLMVSETQKVMSFA